MKTLVTGASGLVGQALCTTLSEVGHEVQRLVRRGPAGPGEVLWDPAAGTLDAASLDTEAVVHLAGENIASGRWTSAKKERILRSRVDSTKLLCETLAELESPPKVLVCASAIGYYGERGSDILDEEAAPGSGFLADVCTAWEAAADPARDAGIRVIHLRIGVVLTRQGGALAKMLPPFRLGVGGPMGSGNQFMSWVTLSDLIRIIVYSIEQDGVSGPLNAVAPHAVTNLEFTKALGRAIKRPTALALPGFMARLALGEMADALLLTSTRVTPKALLEHGFSFLHPELDAAFEAVLAPSAPAAGSEAA